MNVERMLQHLHSRHMEVVRYNAVTVDSDSATFPLWNLSGQMVGFQVYRPDKQKNHKGNPHDERYYTYISRYGGMQPALAAWGIETLRIDRPVFLCEGIFDACRLHKVGIPAIALLGANQLHLRPWLRILPQHRISVVQGDAPGKKMAKFGHESILLPEGEDVGSLTEHDFERIFGMYTDSGGT